jgi:hypothetical protein
MWKSIPLMSSSESEQSRTSAPAGIVRKASTAARSSISEIVVIGLEPVISQVLSADIKIAAHPPAPGFPITEPSVNT